MLSIQKRKFKEGIYESFFSLHEEKGQLKTSVQLENESKTSNQNYIFYMLILALSSN